MVHLVLTGVVYLVTGAAVYAEPPRHTAHKARTQTTDCSKSLEEMVREARAACGQRPELSEPFQLKGLTRAAQPPEIRLYPKEPPWTFTDILLAYRRALVCEPTTTDGLTRLLIQSPLSVLSKETYPRDPMLA